MTNNIAWNDSTQLGAQSAVHKTQLSSHLSDTFYRLVEPVPGMISDLSTIYRNFSTIDSEVLVEIDEKYDTESNNLSSLISTTNYTNSNTTNANNTDYLARSAEFSSEVSSNNSRDSTFLSRVVTYEDDVAADFLKFNNAIDTFDTTQGDKTALISNSFSTSIDTESGKLSAISTLLSTTIQDDLSRFQQEQTQFNSYQANNIAVQQGISTNISIESSNLQTYQADTTAVKDALTSTHTADGANLSEKIALYDVNSSNSLSTETATYTQVSTENATQSTNLSQLFTAVKDDNDQKLASVSADTSSFVSTSVYLDSLITTEITNLVESNQSFESEVVQKQSTLDTTNQTYHDTLNDVTAVNPAIASDLTITGQNKVYIGPHWRINAYEQNFVIQFRRDATNNLDGNWQTIPLFRHPDNATDTASILLKPSDVLSNPTDPSKSDFEMSYPLVLGFLQDHITNASRGKMMKAAYTLQFNIYFENNSTINEIVNTLNAGNTVTMTHVVYNGIDVINYIDNTNGEQSSGKVQKTANITEVVVKEDNLAQIRSTDPRFLTMPTGEYTITTATDVGRVLFFQKTLCPETQ